MLYDILEKFQTITKDLNNEPQTKYYLRSSLLYRCFKYKRKADEEQKYKSIAAVRNTHKSVSEMPVRPTVLTN